jgi:two-component system chemotaxis response regulator CheB
MATATPRLRVLVVDDSATARGLIRALLESEPDLSVCGEAANGRDAVAMALALKPDLITMDLQMPVMDGMTAIEEIMAQRAVPILVLSDVADAHNAMAAVARGALEAARKPNCDEGAGLAARVRILSRIPVIRHIRRTSAHPIAPPPAPVPGPAPVSAETNGAAARIPTLVAIAASTGGPQALADILRRLPASFPVPILIAQHISDGFAAAMAQWLDELSPLQVGLAHEGDIPRPGRVYLADSTMHMTVSAGRCIHLVPRSESDIYRPSCDRLLTSVATEVGNKSLGLILSGMGRDGVKGMLAIRQAGGITLAQDEATSVIFGMNREALLAGAVQRTLPLAMIPGALEAFARPHSGPSGGRLA